LSPAGRVDIAVCGGVLSVKRSGEALFATNLTGRFSKLIWQDGLVAMTLPPVSDTGYEIRFPTITPMTGLRLFLDNVEHIGEARTGGFAIKLAPCQAAQRLTLYLPV
jgi:hypothetical protein